MIFQRYIKENTKFSLHNENKNCKANANKVMQLIYYTKLQNINQKDVIDHQDNRTKITSAIEETKLTDEKSVMKFNNTLLK